MYVVLGTGTHDMCWDANVKMANILQNKGVNYWLDVRQNAPHDWPAWREMFPHYLIAYPITTYKKVKPFI
jgi:esterase/lipase superfamily enzyme